MGFTLKIWRQSAPDAKGTMETYHVADVSPDMSFLEMLDVLNESLIGEGREPVAFDHDCREGICGACSLVIDGQATIPMAPRSTSNRSGPMPFRCSRIS
jgi:succinate dehydrogenase / fumarate reductase iron-sulfur subunit